MPQSQPDLLALIREILADFFVEPEAVTRDSAFVNDLGLESIDVTELVMGLEEELGISIDDEDYENARTVGDLIEKLETILAR